MIQARNLARLTARLQNSGDPRTSAAENPHLEGRWGARFTSETTDNTTDCSGRRCSHTISSRFLLLLLLVFLSAWSSSLVRAESAMFVVSKDDRTLYLGGTVHLLRPEDFPLPTQFEQAYQKAERLYLETNIGGLDDMAAQGRMMQHLTYQDGRTLRDVLDDEAYAALAAHTQQAGIPLAMMQNFRPGLVITMLSVLELQKLGFTPQGVDTTFYERALSDGKPVGELESVDSQIALLADMGEGYESQYVLHALEDFDRAAESIEQIVESWRSGNLQLIESLFLQDMKAQTPELYLSMMVERNENWIPVIETLFEQDEQVLVLVGVAHLAGEDSVLNMLERRGFEISRFQAEPE